MSTYFARSLRSLNADSYRPPLIGLVIASVILLAWGAWFVLAPIPVFVSGQIVSTTGDGMVTANFAATDATQLQAGQAALIVPEGANPAEIGPINAVVADVTTQLDHTQVVLYATLTPSNVNVFVNSFTGKVDVEVERISLAILVFRASSHFVNPPAALVDPQTS